MLTINEMVENFNIHFYIINKLIWFLSAKIKNV